MLKRDKPKCQLHHCSNDLPKEPGVIRMGDEEDYIEFTVCDECVKLMEVLQDKMAELQGREL